MKPVHLLQMCNRLKNSRMKPVHLLQWKSSHKQVKMCRCLRKLGQRLKRV